MTYKKMLAVLLMALGLGACVSYPGGYYRSDVVYQDGSYYSPGAEDYGDYYYAPESRYDYYDPYYGGFHDPFFYGSPLAGFSGYCSVRYRYCPSAFRMGPYYAPYSRFGFSVGFGSGGWYDPYWSRHAYPRHYYGGYYRPPSRHRDDPAPAPRIDTDSQFFNPGQPRPRDFRRVRSVPVQQAALPRPAPRVERQASDDADGSRSSERRRRGAERRESRR